MIGRNAAKNLQSYSPAEHSFAKDSATSDNFAFTLILPGKLKPSRTESHRIKVILFSGFLPIFRCKWSKMNALRIKQPSNRSYSLGDGQAVGISRFKVDSQAQN
ncbi:MAG: hypothetical protein ABSA83_16100 [Verrucomicrobiota bacterium]|jgi:hypothetical protein